MATEFACRNIRYPMGEPDKNPEEKVEMYESGAMEVQVTQPISSCGHK